jgi:hypothetical protein
MKSIAIILFILIIIAIVYTSVSRSEGYSPMVIPFDYESPVKQMQLDKFYQHVIDHINNYDRYGRLRPNVHEGFCCNGSDNNLPYQGYYPKFDATGYEPALNSKYYYDKYREYQDRIASLEDELVGVQSSLESYKKGVAFCKRALTLKPTVAKCFGNYDIVGNSITGIGGEVVKL